MTTNQLQPGYELDAKIALTLKSLGPSVWYSNGPLLHWSTYRDNAMELLEELCREHGWTSRLDISAEDNGCRIYNKDNTRIAHEIESDLPHAISLAILAALEALKVERQSQERNHKNKITQQETLDARVAELEKTMQCNCDLDNWEPEQNTGHSWVCRIHEAALGAEKC